MYSAQILFEKFFYATLGTCFGLTVYCGAVGFLLYVFFKGTGAGERNDAHRPGPGGWRPRVVGQSPTEPPDNPPHRGSGGSC